MPTDRTSWLWGWLAGSLLVLLLMGNVWWLWQQHRTLDDIKTRQFSRDDRFVRIESRLTQIERRLEEHDAWMHELTQQLSVVETGLDALQVELLGGTARVPDQPRRQEEPNRLGPPR